MDAHDLEEACDDEGVTCSGIGDADGLLEQTGCKNGSYAIASI